MYYVYILKSLHTNQIYTGYTTDLQKRHKDHNSGKSIHTNKFRPWKVITSIAFGDRERAVDFERYLKTGSDIAFARRHLI